MKLSELLNEADQKVIDAKRKAMVKVKEKPDNQNLKKDKCMAALYKAKTIDEVHDALKILD